MIQELAVASIGAYQRYVSPHKGYCCAHRAKTGRESCSTFAQRAIRRHGLFTGLALLRRRFRFCTASARALAKQKPDKMEMPAPEPCPLFPSYPAQQRTMVGLNCAGCCFPFFS
ncbi:MAG: membrane protein insertion efficiency factor YidD [Rhodoferax sp.]|nr:membrane protein insertion efficiency factor YidD [Rhodoferax sp.]MBK9234986.1 membrane protein insertion efficiency factor YidD [Rhodoferax sp.]